MLKCNGSASDTELSRDHYFLQSLRFISSLHQFYLSSTPVRKQLDLTFAIKSKVISKVDYSRADPTSLDESEGKARQYP